MGRRGCSASAALFAFMDAYDAMGIGGLILLAAGLYLMWPPLALAVPGAVLLLLAVAGARRGRS